MALASHTSFTTTGVRGLRHDILPMRLYHKAKKLGVWDPRTIDFSQDIIDWQNCTEVEKLSLLALTALFQAGEESVTLDLLPLMMVIAQEGRLEEEMFLTTFLWEEAKHTEFFRRFLDEVVQTPGDLHQYHSPSYRKLFYEELPQTMNALLSDRSPTALIRASATYNMIVEGVLAESGYHGYYNMLDYKNIMPGLKEGIGYLKRDESRHIAYGVFLISRLVAQDPSLWDIVEERMNELLPIALGVVTELYDNPQGLTLGFGLSMESDLAYAMSQYEKRVERIKKARGQTLEQVYQVAETDENG
ncbi:MAG TPA: R2-like ligand-binding oxidase [Ktedonobacteraceae bacterium]|nr:R2-like ligand-binding oxidase [Ktedonobacteraceae bacterium]